MNAEFDDFPDDLLDGDGADTAEPTIAPTADDSLFEYASRGPAHAALVDELLAARADREAKAVARETFLAEEQSALAADDIATAVLGSTLQDDFQAALQFNDSERFDAQKAAIYRAGAKPTAEGGRNWDAEHGARPALDPTEAAMLSRWRSELTTDPSAVLAQVQKDRDERMTAELLRNPGKAFQLSMEFDPSAKRFVQSAPGASAADLNPLEWQAVRQAARGESFDLPPGHDATSFRKLAAPFLGGGVR